MILLLEPSESVWSRLGTELAMPLLRSSLLLQQIQLLHSVEGGTHVDELDGEDFHFQSCSVCDSQVHCPEFSVSAALLLMSRSVVWRVWG